MSAPLLEPRLLAALARLSLVSGQRADGAPAGNRRGRRRGLSLDFADHRPYADGDDLRFLDWQLLARHDQPQIRRYYEEQALPVRILLDLSGSMAAGSPVKLDYARAVAAGLGFVALTSGAVLSIHPFRDRPLAPFGPLRDRTRYHHLSRWLGEVRGERTSDFSAIARRVAESRRSGLTIVLSDFLFPGGFRDGLARLHHARHTVFLLRVVAPEEDDPTMAGDLTLVDAETADEVAWTLTPSVLAAYHRHHAAFDDSLAREARRRGARTARVTTDRDLRPLFLETLTSGGLLE